MVRVVAAVILTILSFGASARDVVTMQAEYDFACKTLPVDCSDIPMPSIIYTKLLHDMGLWGAYVYGEDRVFLRPDAPEETYLHETVHYLLWQEGHTELTRCQTESAARRVTALYLHIPYTKDWYKVYGCHD